LPDDFRGEWAAGHQDSALISEISWRNFFNDSTLIALIDSGLVYNYDMRTALKNIEIANLNMKANKLEYLPTINANIATINQQFRSDDFYSSASSKWYDQKGGEAPSSLFKYQSQHASGLEFSWEIDVWGRIAQQQDMLKADWLNTQESKTAIQTKLIADIASGYFNLLMLDAQIEVAKHNLQLNDSTLGIMQLQFDAGEITALALQQTESQRLVAASMIPTLEAEIAIQENALRTLIGRMPEGISRDNTLNDSLVNFNQTISMGSPLDIVRHRPDIKQAEFELIAANASMNIRQIMRYPQLSLDGVFGVNAMLPENWFNIPGALLGGIVGQISAPIFRNKKLKNQYEVAKLTRDKAELGLQEEVMRAVTEVSNILITVEKQKEQLALANRRVENSQLAVKNASLLFKSGYATYLEVITAQSNALRSELDLVEVKQKQLNTYVALYRSLGGGWQ
jgi:NodT family efflux transporter outer membrane factor (OMF) lipoprotein